MAQWIRVLTALVEDPGSVPSTHIQLPVIPVPKDLVPSSVSVGPCTYMAYKRTQVIRQMFVALENQIADRGDKGGAYKAGVYPRRDCKLGSLRRELWS